MAALAIIIRSMPHLLKYTNLNLNCENCSLAKIPSLQVTSEALQIDVFSESTGLPNRSLNDLHSWAGALV